MKKLFFLTLITLLFGTQVEVKAQKVKYKDLFALLNAKNYTQGEAILKTFLKSDPEHANANLQMAYVYEWKVSKTDVLQEREKLESYADSAIFFYKKSLNLITEKEVKKNEDFYQAYNRRDLRTGKFGIKVSDIQLDIEKAIKNLESKKQNTQGLNSNFDGIKRNYEAVGIIYNGLTEAYPNINTLFLQANEEVIKKLNLTVQLFDSVHFYQQAYKSSLGNVKTTYNQTFIYDDIEGFSKITTENTNYLAEEVTLADFGDWANMMLGLLETDIARIRKALNEYQLKIVEAEKNNQLATLEKFSEEKEQLLKKYDPNPFPLALFKVRIAAGLINYSDSISNLLEADLFSAAELVKRNLLTANEAQKSAQSLLDINYDPVCANYTTFINTHYKGCQQLQEYISGINAKLKVDQLKLDSLNTTLEEKVRWGIYGKDSIALFVGKAITGNYKTLAWEKRGMLGIVAGTKPNAKKGDNVFIALVSPKLNVEWLTEVDLKGTFITNQPSGLIYPTKEGYVVAIATLNQAGNAYSTLLFSTDINGKLKWNTEATIPFLPNSVDASKELPGYVLTNEKNETVYFDLQGKVRQ